ncbi:MAG: hypothetical protein HY541_08505 [Deltaproteobacteria bacterium]|nr:hypothetical protein [Deltaproteobacteria bacterium]
MDLLLALLAACGEQKSEDTSADVGSSYGEAVSISDNIASTDEENVYEFLYIPAQDGLLDNISWDFDLYVATTNGEEYGPAEKWTYQNSSPSDDCN